MKTYIIAMKSGKTFAVELKDFPDFVGEMSKELGKSGFYAGGDIMFNINDVSAIFPASSAVADLARNDNGAQQSQRHTDTLTKGQ